jgi:hypothetical protein
LKVLENGLLRKILEPKREEVAGGWRRMHNEKLHDLCPSRNITKDINSRRMIAGHVARMGEMRK